MSAPMGRNLRAYLQARAVAAALRDAADNAKVDSQRLYLCLKGRDASMYSGAYFGEPNPYAATVKVRVARRVVAVPHGPAA
jgi:hypothetical protein